MDEDGLDDAVFKALADPTRRAILDALFAVDGDQERLHWASHPPAAPEEVEARVRAAFAAGTTLAERLERRGCEALGCGFVRRCHPSDRGL